MSVQIREVEGVELRSLVNKSFRNLMNRTIFFGIVALIFIGAGIMVIIFSSIRPRWQFFPGPLLILLGIVGAIINLISSRNHYRNFIHIRRILEENNITELKRLVMERSESHFKRQVAIAALGDLKEKGAIRELTTILGSSTYSSRELKRWAAWALAKIGTRKAVVALANERGKLLKERKQTQQHSALDWIFIENALATVKWSLRMLAEKNGYEDCNEFIEAVKREIIKERKIRRKQFIQMATIPRDTRCMISHLPIHIEMEEIVACPICENLVKGELLREWLQEEKTCPVCKSAIQFEDCPIVVFTTEAKEKKEEKNF